MGVILWAVGGVSLGYVISYFFQPGLIRAFMGLGDYLGVAYRTLAKIGSASDPDSSIGLTVLLCALIGGTLGVVVAVVLRRVRARS